MRSRLTSRLTYANVASTLALFFALSTGVAYAANEWTGENIVDGSLTGADLAPHTIGDGKIKADSLTAGALADGSVGSGEIADGSVTSADLGFSSVTSAQIATDAVGASEISNNSIDSGEIVDNSLTTADIRGADKSGSISFSAGAVANGRCRNFDVSVSGASTGEAIVFSLKASPPEGMIFYGVRVRATGIGVLAVCNLTGAASPAINSLPVRVITFG
jgi:hypothetical protein